MSPLQRVALIGCGGWGRHILRDLLKLGAETVVVARSGESIQRAREGGAHRIVESVAEIGQPDGIVVAVPTTAHAGVLDQALSFQVPVFVEKPLTNDIESARRFADSKLVFVMDKWRYHGGVVELARMVSDQRYGEYRGLQTRRHSLFNNHSDVDAVWILAPHDLSIILEIMGRIPEPLAAVGHAVGGDSTLIGLLDDHVTIDVSGRSNVFRREVRVWFEEAVVTLEDGYAETLDVRSTVPGAEPLQTSVPIDTRMPLEAELDAFLGYLRGLDPPKSSAADGFHVVERLHQLRLLAGI